MRLGVAKPLSLWGVVMSLSVGGTVSLLGQDPRDACLAQAYKEFDAGRRQQLLMRCLNPSAGAPRGAWPLGVQLLAQTLIEDGHDSVAEVWLRWAVRLAPDLQPDTVQFLPRVIAAYRSARDFVSRTRTLGDSVTATTWLWPAQESSDAAGRLQVAAALGVPVQVAVQGVGPIGVGGSIALGPGSYEITASATGYDNVRVTREVVPGVTTVLEFHPRSALAAVAPPVKTPAAKTQAPGSQVATQKKKGFPVVWVVVGAAAAGGAVALLAHKSSPTTGSMTYTFTP
jgi:hypothetical protein